MYFIIGFKGLLLHLLISSLILSSCIAFTYTAQKFNEFRSKSTLCQKINTKINSASRFKANPLYSTVIAPPKVDKDKSTKKGNKVGEPSVPDFLFKENRDIQKEFEEYIGENKYMLILYNDPFNKRLYVQSALMEILSFTEAVAEAVMLQAHNYGFAVAGEFSKELAIDYAKKLVDKGLVAEAKPCNDDDSS